MLSTLADAFSWRAGSHSRPVVLSSPHPASECLRRLDMVTTRRGASWYLDRRTVGRPAPRLRGDVGASGILVARWEDARGRNSFAPCLEARLQAGAGGGTTLTGRVGLHPSMRRLMPVIAGVGGLIAVSLLASGIVTLVRGHLTGLPFVLGPLGLATFVTGLDIAGLRSLERGIPKLLQELNGVLDSTATFAGPATGVLR